MLVGLGSNPLYAAGICLMWNTAPCRFWISRAHLSLWLPGCRDIPELAISADAGSHLAHIVPRRFHCTWSF
ncbi:MAG: L-lactate permease [Saprospiraceae bacterium]|nr:L-lactate permease [Saprospiraceae bacterium]